MKISKSAGYALVATGYIAENCKDGAILAARISKEYDISAEYLLKVLQQLVRAGILRSKRGPRGGFSLAGRAEDTTLLQILEAVDGPLMSYLNLAELTNHAPFSIKMEAVCKKANEDVRAIYESSALSSFIDT